MARYTYVISDIHGQYDALRKMMDVIGFDYDDELYILGDIIDRGPKSVECVRWVMEQDNVLTLMGNHELMWYDTYIRGGAPLYPSYTQIKEAMSESEQKAMQKWIENMPECKLINVNGQKYFLNHTQAISSKYIEEDLTDRLFPDYEIYKDYYNYSVKDIVCVHGHIPTMELRRWNGQEKSSTIWKNKNGSIIDIDCGAGYPQAGGRLGCLRLNDGKEFYVEVE